MTIREERAGTSTGAGPATYSAWTNLVSEVLVLPFTKRNVRPSALGDSLDDVIHTGEIEVVRIGSRVVPAGSFDAGEVARATLPSHSDLDMTRQIARGRQSPKTR